MRTALIILGLTLSLAATATARTHFTGYRSWNSRIYPVWRDGDPRYRDCWKGGQVTFDIKNDAPTLVGAKTTFNINVHPPGNQTVLPNGTVVWSQNCTVNGTQYIKGEHVYPEFNTSQEWTGVFLDGTPFTTTLAKKPRFIFVWKTWGRFWQVAGGPSSVLTIGTDNVPLGSYNMEVVIYHCRGKDRFIPLGYVSTQFSITDQIPFVVTLSQTGDVNQADQSFIQNRPVTFNVGVHDPSQYLSGADITFTWDFGDNSGTLISRQPSVTHTYLSIGSFRPQLMLMAAIPNGCVPNPTAGGVITAAQAITESPAAQNINMAASPQPVLEQESIASVDPAAANNLAAATADNQEAVTPENQVSDVLATGEIVTDSIVETEGLTVIDAAETVIPLEEVVAVTDDTVLEAAAAANGETDTVAPAANIIINNVVTDTTVVQTVPSIVPVVEGEIVETEATANEVIAEAVITDTATVAVIPTTAQITQNEIVGEGTEEPQAALNIAKRQAPEIPPEGNCMIYRYGSFSSTLDVVQGIESVEIVEMSNVAVLATNLEQNAVDLTVTCQGSLPSEVCTMVMDSDCISPLQTECNAVTPTECQMILRRFFNDSGTFCINVSLTNDVSFAVASARLSVTVDSGSSTAGAATTILGVLVLVCAVGTIALTYRRMKAYRVLKENSTDGIMSISGLKSVPMIVWNILTRQSTGENRPLLQGRVV